MDAFGRTLSRFVGKVMLILEALAPAVAAHAAEAAAPPRADQMGKPRSSGSLAVAWSVAVIQSRQHVAAAAAAHASAAARGTVQQAAPQAAPPQVMSPSSVEAVAVAQQLAPEALAAAWAEAAGDLREALAAAAELVAACGGMGRLQAVLEAEELRDKFAAAAGDLGLALSGLQPLQAVAPPDVAEDVAAVQRQLDVLRFCSSAAQEQLAAQLLQVRAGGRSARWAGSAALVLAVQLRGQRQRGLFCVSSHLCHRPRTPANPGRGAAPPAAVRGQRCRGAAPDGRTAPGGAGARQCCRLAGF